MRYRTSNQWVISALTFECHTTLFLSSHLFALYLLSFLTNVDNFTCISRPLVSGLFWRLFPTEWISLCWIICNLMIASSVMWAIIPAPWPLFPSTSGHLLRCHRWPPDAPCFCAQQGSSSARYSYGGRCDTAISKRSPSRQGEGPTTCNGVSTNIPRKHSNVRGCLEGEISEICHGIEYGLKELFPPTHDKM